MRRQFLLLSLVASLSFACKEEPCDPSLETCPVCGDAILEGSEVCDDGNAKDDDICRSDCTFVSAICGDNFLQQGEACDDGNLLNNDACTSQCQLAPAVCLDGILQVGEECDDGDFNDFNGCNRACRFSGCGDGVVDGVGGEQCDFGANQPGQGCSAACQFEICGDGAVGLNETCDDGNFNDFDGCTVFCQGACGNGLLDPGEECDQGAANGQNSEVPNHCHNDCTLPFCGDGVIDDLRGEECDSTDVTHCNIDCTFPGCGDGILDNGFELCDDGNLLDGDGCNSHCQSSPRCADGIVESTDGNCYFPSTAILRTPIDFPIDDAVLFDLEGDDDLDIVTPFGFFLGNGDGSFQSIRGFGLQPFFGQRVAVADLNGDTFGDVVLTRPDGVVVLPSSDGTNFLPPRFFLAGGFVGFVEIADADLDGRRDLITVTRNQAGELFFGTFLGNGDATFRAPINSALNSGADVLTFGDVTGDSVVDAVFFGDPITLFAGDGAGGFSLRSFVTTSAAPSDLELADLNNDGTLDLIATCPSAQTIEFFSNDGLGNFQALSAATGLQFNGQGFQSVSAADIDADGTPELAVAVGLELGSLLSVDYATGQLLPASVGISPGSIPLNPFTSDISMLAARVLIGDLDGQNQLDLVTLNLPVSDFPFATLGVIIHQP